VTLTRGRIFLANLSDDARTVWHTTITYGNVTQVERGVFLRCLPRPHPKGRAPSSLKNFVTLTYSLTVWPRSIKFAMVTCAEAFQQGQTRSLSHGCGFQQPQFLTHPTCSHATGKFSHARPRPQPWPIFVTQMPTLVCLQQLIFQSTLAKVTVEKQKWHPYSL